jgi:NDMA-dependent alcohol dehydrogenase
MKTRAAILTGTHRPFEVVELELDQPRRGELLLRMVAAGLCHSDIHIADGVMETRFPIVAGHEAAGIVAQVGPDVTKFKPGDHIVCSFIPSCGKCRYCSTGRQNLCDDGATILQGCMPDGTFRFHYKGEDLGAMNLIGAFSELAVIPTASCVKVDDQLPLDSAVTVSCGVPTGWGSAVYAGDVRPGDITVVVGMGGVGMNAVQGAAYAGAKYVIGIDPVRMKRDFAPNFGATHTFASMDEAADTVRELSWGQGADQVLCLVGTMTEDVIDSAVKMIGKGGVVVVTGVADYNCKNVHISGLELTYWQKTIKGALYGSSNPHYDIVKLLRLYDAGQLKLDELITARYKLEDINKGYQDLRDDKNLRGIIVF